MKKIILILLLLVLIVSSAIILLSDRTTSLSKKEILAEKFTKEKIKVVDHSKFAQLKRNFNSPEEVTRECLSCHNERDKEIMRSNHWNWEREEFIEGRGVVYIGKKNVLNNYCLGSSGNEAACGKCHAGLGMTQENFSFTDPSNIDCLVCHDNTDTYMKASDKGGAPAANLNLSYMAGNVGKPTRANCGYCHFFGGGGNNVKHGDLEEALFNPDKALDVHMAVEGVNLQCTDCHRTENHVIAGKMYSLSSTNSNRVLCEDCHGEFPHKESILNEHTVKVACQTCHIPYYAKSAATKMGWDWSTAGDLRDGEPYTIKDSNDDVVYLSTKGTFSWGTNLKPDYIWFNGTADHYILGDTVRESDSVLTLNPLKGSYNERGAKIVPVKIHTAMQPFDPVTRMLIQPKLAGSYRGDSSYWNDFDWVKASEAGMKNSKLPFSGKVAFIETKMYWPVNHMVSGKEFSLGCTDCHSRSNSRISSLTDFYLPGRDYSAALDIGGFVLIFLTLFAVVTHAAFRVVILFKKRRRI
jgi:octaheme c-type cytochrome (tetrathionate reductase family)